MNCIFSNNSANSNGGAISMSSIGGNLSAQITNCVFNANGIEHLRYDDGNANTQPHFMNCTFYGALLQE
ncbi:hypothetical protein [Arcticibacterium luteifluviistationis]|nr:hypothetical protein [Arcticibacterium luteifluviistationis]